MKIEKRKTIQYIPKESYLLLLSMLLHSKVYFLKVIYIGLYPTTGTNYSPINCYVTRTNITQLIIY